MSILPIKPGEEDGNEVFAEMFSLFSRSPELRKIVEEKKAGCDFETLTAAFKAHQAEKPLEFGYIKKNHVRLWAMAYIKPKKPAFSKSEKSPYYQGFWVKARTIQKALDSARDSVGEVPAIVNLYIANRPGDKSLAFGSTRDGQSWWILRCPKREKLRKPEPSSLLKKSVSAAVGIVLMVVLSLYWPRELSNFSWLLSIAGIGVFLAWKRWGSSAAVGGALNVFRPRKRVNIIEDWCPTVEELNR